MSGPAPSVCDVAIVGGGMVGASLALALSATALKVVLIEAVTADSDAQPSFDDRTTALGNGARRILDTLGVWDDVQALTAPIRHIHVSDAGHFGFARLDAATQGLPALGYTLSNRDLGAALWRALARAPQLQSMSPARVSAAEFGATAVRLQVATAQAPAMMLEARLVVAADGANSLIKQIAGIDSVSRDYGQEALVTNLRTDRPAADVAYERFTAEGPLALLPRHDRSYTVVWTLAPARAQTLLACSDADFINQLQQGFGWRAGRISAIGRRGCYPLSLVQAERVTATRLAVIGNAAQALHPVAAQGFNLGLRDAAELAECLVQADDPGAAAVLERYAAQRAADRRGMAGFTDGLVRLFSSRAAGAVVTRNLGLLLFDVAPPAKQALSRLSWGFGDVLPRLARGLGLRP